MPSKKAEAEENDDGKFLDPAKIKLAIKALERGSLPFAYGENRDGEPVLVVAKRGKPKAIADQLKAEGGVAKPTWGMASGGDGALNLDVEGRVLAGMRKGVQKFCKENKIAAVRSVALRENGVAAVEPDEDSAGPNRPAAPETPAPAAGAPEISPETAKAIKGVSKAREALSQVSDKIQGLIASVSGGDESARDALKSASTAYAGIATLLRERIQALDEEIKPRFQKLYDQAGTVAAKVRDMVAKLPAPAAENAGTPAAVPGPVETRMAPLAGTGNVQPTEPGVPAEGTVEPIAPPAPPVAAAASAETPPAPAKIPAKLGGPVGQGGQNNPEDVSVVQTLLNKRGFTVPVTGDCGPDTIAAITGLQKKKLNGFSDGLVDPDGQTWFALLGLVAPKPKPKPPPEPVVCPSPEPIPGPPPKPKTIHRNISGVAGEPMSGSVDASETYLKKEYLLADADIGDLADEDGNERQGAKFSFTGEKDTLDVGRILEDKFGLEGVDLKLTVSGATANAEASTGDDGGTFGATANFVEVALENVQTGTDHDESSKVAVSAGEGLQFRVHRGDSDGDGRRELGLGADVAFLGVDLKTEDPVRSLINSTPGGAIFAAATDILPDENLTPEPVFDALDDFAKDISELKAPDLAIPLASPKSLFDGIKKVID